MAYIPYTPIKPESDADAIKEISISESGTEVSDKNRKDACFYNLDLCSDALETRTDIVKKSVGIDDDGALYSMTKELFYDRVVIHIGSSLYTYSAEEAVIEKLDCVLPDKISKFVYFMSCLYIYCDYRIFKLDDKFELSECEPYVPLVFNNLSPSLPDKSDKLDVSLNLISPVIRVKYTKTALTVLSLPYTADLSRPVKAFFNGTRVNDKKIELTEESIKISVGTDYDANKMYEVEYYVKNPSDIGFDDTLYRCSAVDTFGGAVGGGTRIFFTGDSEKKGYYYKSELQNPLYVPSKEYEIIGDGCENVTSLIKMYGQLVILTEKSVYMMSYSLGENGPVFSIKQVTNAVGCDMSGSVQLVDNRVVFANSKSGIYIIDAVEDNGEHNIKPLATKILRGGGMGFLDNDNEMLKSAHSVDYDRKYYLFVGERAYIWDYDESPFVESGSYSKAQNRLDWYIYTGVVEGKTIKAADSFFIFSPVERIFYGFGENSDNVEFSYKSPKESFGRADTKKYVTRLLITLLSDVHKEITLSVFGDGECYYERSINLCNKKKTISINLPKKPMFDFSYSLCGNGKIELHSAKAQYMYLSK